MHELCQGDLYRRPNESLKQESCPNYVTQPRNVGLHQYYYLLEGTIKGFLHLLANCENVGLFCLDLPKFSSLSLQNNLLRNPVIPNYSQVSNKRTCSFIKFGL